MMGTGGISYEEGRIGRGGRLSYTSPVNSCLFPCTILPILRDRYHRRNMALNHPYRRFQIPSNAPFELKPSHGKGWGAFATRPIKRGDVILREGPLFSIRKPHEDITEADVRAALEQLSPAEQQQFMSIRDNAQRPFARMELALVNNSFRLSESPEAHGLFPLYSRLNHSCIPNTKGPGSELELKEGVMTCHALCDISAGEEILITYNQHFGCWTRAERHRQLGFVCHCPACEIGTPFQALSDMRRTLIRGLQYLTLGVDFGPSPASPASPASPLIVDSKLKAAAEALAIPISTRLIADLLLFCLRDAEGILDDFHIKRNLPGMKFVASLFRDQSSERIAKCAMARETWPEKFCVACGLYGRKDAHDPAYPFVFKGARALMRLRASGVPGPFRLSTLHEVREC
ncbi:hypothetical protein GGR56DRAFT_640448 [Xylariaceae sp. FL0804]|nr:hypothetical protein GGR56DRAFT_640448 [Xylariaceae sp. FL0804]